MPYSHFIEPFGCDGLTPPDQLWSSTAGDGKDTSPKFAQLGAQIDSTTINGILQSSLHKGAVQNQPVSRRHVPAFGDLLLSI